MSITSDLAAKFRRALRNRQGTSLSAAELRHLGQLGVMHLLAKLEADELLSEVGLPALGSDVPTVRADSEEREAAPKTGKLPTVFSVRTLSDRWSCSEGLVRKLIADGSLEHFRRGTLIRIPVDAVLRREQGSVSTEP